MSSADKHKKGRRPGFWVEMILIVVVVAASAASIGAVYAPLPNQDLLVDPAWLASRLGDDNLVVIDARDLLSYRRSHIPGAVNIGDRDIHDFTGPAGRALKSPEALEEIFRRAGISNGDTVVAYTDDRSPGMAERIFFVLEYLGFQDVRVLSGGFGAWEDSGGATNRETPSPEPGNFTAAPRAHMLADTFRIQSIMRQGNGHIIDVRTLEEYVGEAGETDRLGHIEGAAHLEAKELFTNVSTPISAHRMRLAFDAVAVHSYHPIVVYGNTGTQAASIYFAVRLLGGEVASVYEGSWAEWAADDSLPVAKPVASAGPVGVSTTCW